MIVLIDDNSRKGLHIYRVHEGNLKLPITIIPLTVISLTPPQMQCEWNDVAFEEFTRHATKIKLIHPKSNNKK
jgi:hypothetical protein